MIGNLLGSTGKWQGFRVELTKVAVGNLLDGLRNDITRETPASFEPSIDYVVTKIKVYGDRDILPRDVISRKLSVPNAERIFFIRHAPRAGFTIDEIFNLTKIDRWFLDVRRTIEDFLMNEWRGGALLGSKAEQAFFVRCDRTTMTQNDVDQGRLVCLVGVAVLKPAEFVIFRISQNTATTRPPEP